MNHIEEKNKRMFLLLLLFCFVLVFGFLTYQSLLSISDSYLSSSYEKQSQTTLIWFLGDFFVVGV